MRPNLQRKIFVGTLLMLACAVVGAQETPVPRTLKLTDLLRYCQNEQNLFQQGLCDGYIMAVVDEEVIFERLPNLPNEMTQEQCVKSLLPELKEQEKMLENNVPTTAIRTSAWKLWGKKQH